MSSRHQTTCALWKIDISLHFNAHEKINSFYLNCFVYVSDVPSISGDKKKSSAKSVWNSISMRLLDFGSMTCWWHDVPILRVGMNFNHLQLNVFFKDLQFNRLIYVAVQRLMKCRKFCICARIIYSFKKRQMDLVLLRDIAHHHETLRFDPVLLFPTRIFYAFFFTYFWFRMFWEHVFRSFVSKPVLVKVKELFETKTNEVVRIFT